MGTLEDLKQERKRLLAEFRAISDRIGKLEDKQSAIESKLRAIRLKEIALTVGVGDGNA